MNSLSRAGRELSKSEKVLLSTVAIMAGGFLCWTLILEPGLTSIKPLTSEVAELESRVAELSNLNTTIALKEKQLSELKVQYEDAIKVFPKNDKYPELTKELRELATSLELKLTSETYEEPRVYVEESATNTTPGEGEVAQEALMSFNVSLTLEGDFNKVLELVKKLESGNRIVEVQNISSSEQSTTINLLYYFSNSSDKEDYSFNSGTYGQDNLFN